MFCRQSTALRRKTRRRRLAAESLEARLVFAASLGWDGPGQGSAELTYYIANSPSSLTQAETDAAIETALAAWSDAADITFTQTTQSGLRDSIDITFTRIDGVGGTLAQAYFPDDVNPARIAGDIQFDTSDAWEVGNSLGSQAFDLVYVAVHEIGHSLGLDHTNLVGSVLAPYVSPNQSFSSLASVDIAAIAELYALADGVTTTETSADETPTDETQAYDIDTDTDDTGDTEDDPFPRRRWRRGGNWHRWGGRLNSTAPEYNYVNPTDETTEDPIDDGGLVDDTDDTDVEDTEDEADEERCHGGHNHHAHSNLSRLFGADAESLITRFDTDDDAALSEAEVPRRLWSKFTESEVDADGDGLVTLTELETAIMSARQEAFDEKDADGDEILIEDEVSDRIWSKIVAADTDADGGVSFEEFDAFLDEQQAESDETSGRRHHGHQSLDAVFAAIGRVRSFGLSRGRR